MSKNQSSPLFDRCVMHLWVCPNFFRVRCSPSLLRPTLQRSRQRFEIGKHLCSMFAASLPAFAASLPHPHLPFFAASLPHLCRSFAFLLLGASFASGVFCNITCPIFYSISRSWPHLAAGHSWFHRPPQSTTFPKMPEFKNIDL